MSKALRGMDKNPRVGSLKTGLNRVKCFKHISILVLFSIISVSFMLFCWIFENNCLGGGVLARLFCPQVPGFALSLCPRGGDSPFQKKSSGVCLGGGGEWSDLELTDALSFLSVEYL